MHSCALAVHENHIHTVPQGNKDSLQVTEYRNILDMIQ